ncbi:MAG: hypothetical protein A2W90_22820 [Bacteroidetes bacterium GWF2_42_66]|nr:MAG: hypothetical protein A2W92_22405 [Bacteroidetes bacterium GWA2_42_15]OFX99448.1 MAG: hypothetical protein A2W89_12505 [Bacteroidetes bacterium GWE2_42_39]OFY46979.1 MAG: hypothetical protein A2W90_22820 [Bacteroidetes bacterium GWF2_42_66]HBL76872.1 histidinol-phosphatase [Prolixibacteraceae bacterium]HCR90506.1 histidinol-phosphatase [Prolixibacteraceae bacterium]
MRQFRADLHIHTVLSPCADLDMSPENIVARAKKQKLDIIGITDHNSTRNVEAVSKVAAREDIFVLPGCEINTSEEIHVLVFFPDTKAMNDFQQYIDRHLPPIANHPGLFGYQVFVDEHSNIIGYEEKYLGSALEVGIDEVEIKVHEIGGIFIPAHVDRYVTSIYSQLGFIPESLQFEALQISKRVNETDIRSKYSIPDEISIVKFSDAHYPENVGEVCTILEMQEISFSEIKKALLKIGNRGTKIP